MNTQKKLVALVAMISTLVILNGCTPSAKGNTKSDKISNINKMRNQELAELYRQVPGARGQIANAYGYAVFSNTGIYLFAISSGKGFGVARNNKTGKNTYMKMLSAGAGLGMGLREFTGIFIFANKTVYDYFLETGFTANASADAAAQYDGEGDAASLGIDVSPGVRLYQLTGDGVALQATIQGTKFWKDDELN